MTDPTSTERHSEFEWNDGPLGRVFRARVLADGGIELELVGGDKSSGPERLKRGVTYAHAAFLTTPEGAVELLTGFQTWIEQL